MWHQFIFGLLLGWGAAIPIGPVNLEVVRRNLRFGMPFGITFGLGACSADMTYFVLLLSGVLVFFNDPWVLRIIGVLGSCILLWFGISALRLTVKRTTIPSEFKEKERHQAGWRHYLQAYFMTLLNPMTVIFWSSISAQLAALSHRGSASSLYAGIGVLLGTISWILVLNSVVHFTRHRLSDKVMHYLNVVGGVLLLGFAAFGFWHALA